MKESIINAYLTIPSLYSDSTAKVAKRFKVTEEEILEIKRWLKDSTIISRLNKHYHTFSSKEGNPINYISWGEHISDIPMPVAEYFSYSKDPEEGFKKSGEQVSEVIDSDFIVRSKWVKRNTPEGKVSEFLVNTKVEDTRKESSEAILDVLRDFQMKSVYDFYSEKTRAPEQNMAMISLADLHIDKLGYRGETNNEVLSSYFELLSKSLLFNPEELWIVCGHDFFNCDHKEMTTAGTPQSNAYSAKDAFEYGLQLMSEILAESLKEVAKIKFFLIMGNHDYYKSQYLAIALSKIFPQIEFVIADHERTYDSYGVNGFLLTHALCTRGVKNMNSIYAVENPQDFALKAHKFILTGHLHSKKQVEYMSTEENYGIVWKQLPSLSVLDKWHYDNNFIGNIRSMSSLIFDKNNGWVAELFSNVK